jgi:hypothetical protein
MATRDKKITSVSEFMRLAWDNHYMTITKPYGVLAVSGKKLKGQCLTEGPQGPLKEPSGWIEVQD